MANSAASIRINPVMIFPHKQTSSDDRYFIKEKPVIAPDKILRKNNKKNDFENCLKTIFVRSFQYVFFKFSTAT